MNLTILDILEMYESEYSFSIYFNVKLFWFDPNLVFQFLKNNTKLKIESREQIWFPNLQFEHAHYKEIINTITEIR